MNTDSRDQALALPAVWDALFRRRGPEAIVQWASAGAEAQTFREVNAQSHCLAAYMRSKGLQQGDRVLLLSTNGGLYLSMDLAVQFCGAINVTVSPDYSAAHLVEILRQTNPRFVLISSYGLYEQHRGILDAHVADYGVEMICHIKRGEELTEIDRVTMLQNAVDFGKVYWREQAQDIKEAKEAVTLDTPSTIVYDRDTPLEGLKGVVLTHGNFAAAIEGIRQRLPEITEKDILMNPLSPATVLGRLGGYYFPLTRGLQAVQVHNLMALMPAIRQYKPTWLVAVPSILRFVARRVQQRFVQGGFLRKGQFRRAWELAQQVEGTGVVPTDWQKFRRGLGNRWVFSRMKDQTLPTLKAFFADQNGLDADTELLFDLMGVPVIAGLGAAESAGPAVLNGYAERRRGTAGSPIGAARVRIAAVEHGPGASSSYDTVEVGGGVAAVGYWDANGLNIRKADWLAMPVKARLDKGIVYPAR